MITYQQAKEIAQKFIATINETSTTEFFIDPETDIVENDEVYAFGKYYRDENGERRRLIGAGIYTIDKRTGKLGEAILSPMFPNLSIKGLHPVK